MTLREGGLLRLAEKTTSLKLFFVTVMESILVPTELVPRGNRKGLTLDCSFRNTALAILQCTYLPFKGTFQQEENMVLIKYCIQAAYTFSE